MADKQLIDNITAMVAYKFPSFGGGRKSDWNPITNALADRPPQFAASVDIREVVEYILTVIEE